MSLCVFFQFREGGVRLDSPMKCGLIFGTRSYLITSMSFTIEMCFNFLEGVRERERHQLRFTCEMYCDFWVAIPIRCTFEICTFLGLGRGCGRGNVPRFKSIKIRASGPGN